MAEDVFNLANIVGATGNVTGTILDIVIYLVVIIVVGMIIFFIYFLRQFKYKVEVIMNTGGKDVSILDKAREIKQPDGIYWKLFKLKDVIPRPPSEAIYLDEKGRVKARCFYTSEGNYEYQSAITPKLVEGKNYYDNFEPLTTKQRGILVSQIVKANSRQKRKWTDMLPMMAGLGAIVILVVCMLIYWENIASPVVEMQNINNEMQKTINENMKIQNEITYRQEAIIKSLGLEIEDLKKGDVAPD